jgi:hypothetical protein
LDGSSVSRRYSEGPSESAAGATAPQARATAATRTRIPRATASGNSGSPQWHACHHDHWRSVSWTVELTALESPAGQRQAASAIGTVTAASLSAAASDSDVTVAPPGTGPGPGPTHHSGAEVAAEADYMRGSPSVSEPSASGSAFRMDCKSSSVDAEFRNKKLPTEKTTFALRVQHATSCNPTHGRAECNMSSATQKLPTEHNTPHSIRTNQRHDGSKESAYALCDRRSFLLRCDGCE